MHTSYQQRATIRHPGLGSWYHKRGKLNPTLPLRYSLERKAVFMGAAVSSNPNSNPWQSMNLNPD